MLWLLNLIALAFAFLQGTSGSLHGSINSVIAGNLKSALYGNQVKTFYDYNARLHLRRMRTVNRGQTLLANFHYDGAGSEPSVLAGAWGAQGSLSKSGRRNRMDEQISAATRSVLCKTMGKAMSESFLDFARAQLGGLSSF